MTSEQFWVRARRQGFTRFREFEVEGRRRVIMQSRDRMNFPSLTHPDDLTPDQREAEIERFLGLNSGL